MAIVAFGKDEVVDYVPVAERDSEDPCVIGMKVVTYAQAKQYEREIAVHTKGVSPANVMAKTAEAARAVQKKQFLEHVVSVRNYTVRGRKIETAAELWEVIDQPLMAELIQAMESQSKLTEGQLKNSVPQSGSGSEDHPES